jgi:hypothetical protein
LNCHAIEGYNAIKKPLKLHVGDLIEIAIQTENTCQALCKFAPINPRSLLVLASLWQWKKPVMPAGWQNCTPGRRDELEKKANATKFCFRPQKMLRFASDQAGQKYHTLDLEDAIKSRTRKLRDKCHL